ncbi:MAG: glycosyltransferase family 4 protein [Desulfosporosinus sp.]|nr:glycosyltransferase family 4 protein [Desulfosporosinus sp.]
MKKVLVIAYFFPPLGGSGVQRTLKFVKYLPNYGIQPLVSTVKSGHNFAYDQSLLKEIPDTVQVHRSSSLETLWLRSLIEKFAHLRRSQDVSVNTSESNSENVTEIVKESNSEESLNIDPGKSIKQRLFEFVDNYLFIPDSKIRWLPFGFLKSLQLARREHVDYLFSTSYPYTTHLIALLVHKLYKKPWIADFRDPWVGNKAMQKQLPFRIKLDAWLENKIVQNADHLVNVTPSLTEMYKKRYPKQAQKMITITNGFDPDDFIGVSPVIQKKFTLIHTGIIAEAYDMETFVAGVASFLQSQPEARSNFQALFIGYVPPKYEELLKNKLPEQVTILPYMSHKEVLNYQAGAHLLFLTFDQSVDIAYSGKIFDYIGVGKPILGLLPKGVAAQLIQERKLGTVVPLGNSLELADAVSQYFNIWLDRGLEGERAGTVIDAQERQRANNAQEVQSTGVQATATEKCADFNRVNLAGQLASLMK